MDGDGGARAEVWGREPAIGGESGRCDLDEPSREVWKGGESIWRT